jgi:hypothetical protein
MELYYRDQRLGSVTGVSQDGPEIWASFTPDVAALPFKHMWDFMADEDNWDKDPPVPPEYLNDSNWSVIDDTGKRRGIYLPAVYPDSAISWHWRE